MIRRTLSPNLLLAALLLLGALLFVQHSSQHFSHDDEGGYTYAAWRISAGEVPYRDFFTNQLPVFLYWGGLIVRLFGRSYMALRLATTFVALLAAYLLYALNRELYGPPVALVSLALFLVEANAFGFVRFFLPEATMLLFIVAGLYAFVLGEKRGRRGYVWLASVLFGLAILNKLFGFLPLVGCILYLLYAWLRERRPFREVLGEGLALGVPALLLVGGAAVVFMRITPYFFTAVFEHHTMQGAALSRWQTILKGLRFYQSYIVGQPIAAGLAVLGAMAVLRHSSVARRGQAIETLVFWQVPTVLAFLGLTRPLLSHHLAYLVPAVATLSAISLWLLLRGHWRIWETEATVGAGNPTQRRVWAVVALVVGLVAVYPWAMAGQGLMQMRVEDPFSLPDLIRTLTAPDEFVMCDHVGINFLAGRRTTYWVVGISGGASDSGQIRGEMLIGEMESQNVAMVVMDTRSRHFTNMENYPAFRRYVQTHYSLVDKLPGEGRLLDVYTRQDIIPSKLDANFAGELALTGMRLARWEVAGGAFLNPLLRWQALKKMVGSYRISLRLIDAGALQWAQEEGVRIKGSGHSTESWEPGQLEMQEYSLRVIPGTPPGSYYLTAQVYEPTSQWILRPTGGEKTIASTGEVVIAPVRILPAAVPPRPDTLPISVTMRAPLAEGLDLLGSGSLPKAVVAGQPLDQGLFWYAPTRPQQDYHLEFRLTEGEHVVQRWPMEIAAEYPTSTWRNGEVVYGRYHLPTEKTLPEGHYALRVVALGRDGHTFGETDLIAELFVKASSGAK